MSKLLNHAEFTGKYYRDTSGLPALGVKTFAGPVSLPLVKSELETSVQASHAFAGLEEGREYKICGRLVFMERIWNQHDAKELDRLFELALSVRDLGQAETLRNSMRQVIRSIFDCRLLADSIETAQSDQEGPIRLNRFSGLAFLASLNTARMMTSDQKVTMTHRLLMVQPIRQKLGPENRVHGLPTWTNNPELAKAAVKGNLYRVGGSLFYWHQHFRVETEEFLRLLKQETPMDTEGYKALKKASEACERHFDGIGLLVKTLEMELEVIQEDIEIPLTEFDPPQVIEGARGRQTIWTVDDIRTMGRVRGSRSKVLV